MKTPIINIWDGKEKQNGEISETVEMLCEGKGYYTGTTKDGTLIEFWSEESDRG